MNFRMPFIQIPKLLFFHICFIFLSTFFNEPFENKFQTWYSFVLNIIQLWVFSKTKDIILHNYSTVIKNQEVNSDTMLVCNPVVLKVWPQTSITNLTWELARSTNSLPLPQPAALNQKFWGWGSGNLCFDKPAKWAQSILNFENHPSNSQSILSELRP